MVVTETATMASTLLWWREMGVDTLIDEEPTPWLDRGKPINSSPRRRPGPLGSPGDEQAPASAGATSAPTPLPSTLIGLQQWLASDPDIPEGGPVAQRLVFSGNPASELMILIDMPLMGDRDAGQLLAGEVGELTEKMLVAIGWDRETTYFATLCPGRSPAGMLGDGHLPRLGEIARHHIALAAPKQVWLMGDAVSRAILGMGMMDARGILHKINHAGGQTEAVVSFSPRFLHQNPKRKSDAWADMQLLIRGNGA